MKLNDKIPIWSVITPYIDFSMKTTQHFVIGQDLRKKDGGPTHEKISTLDFDSYYGHLWQWKISLSGQYNSETKFGSVF